MHTVLISCFSRSIRASSVAEVVLLYTVSNVKNNVENTHCLNVQFPENNEKM